MRKGVHVILLLLAYALASWSLRGLPWAPPPLVAPGALAQLGVPFAGVREAPRRSGDDAQGLEGLHAPAAAPLGPAASAEVVGAGTATAPAGSWLAFLDKLRELSAGRRGKVRILHLGD